jgi:hypothetical protein
MRDDKARTAVANGIFDRFHDRRQVVMRASRWDANLPSIAIWYAKHG